jgi:hypothetical protein
MARGEEEGASSWRRRRRWWEISWRLESARRRLYSARASWRGNIWAWDRAIARTREKIRFPRRFGAFAGGAWKDSRALFGG